MSKKVAAIVYEHRQYSNNLKLGELQLPVEFRLKIKIFMQKCKLVHTI